MRNRDYIYKQSAARARDIRNSDPGYGLTPESVEIYSTFITRYGTQGLNTNYSIVKFNRECEHRYREGSSHKDDSYLLHMLGLAPLVFLAL